jgi:hypothetical protein
MRAMRWFLLSLAIAGCASAGKGNSIIGGLTDAGARGDGSDNNFPLPDASLIDAPPQQVTMTETASNAIARNNSFACLVSQSSTITDQNSYYRVFAPADYSLTTTLHITQITFGIESASAGTGGMQPAAVKLGTYTGTLAGTMLDLSKVQPIASANIQIADGEGTTMTVPITADLAPTANLIVELAIPNGQVAGNSFFIGTNTAGERKPGYTRAVACGFSNPTTMASIAPLIPTGETDIVMTVTGTP